VFLRPWHPSGCAAEFVKAELVNRHPVRAYLGALPLPVPLKFWPLAIEGLCDG
jgi:hypothetical protein